MPHPTPRSCSAPLPCPTALSPRRIRLSPPALPPRQIPPGGHHREAGESLGIRVGITQPTSELGADGALPDLPGNGRGEQERYKWLCSRWQKSAYLSASKRCGGTREKEQPSQTEEGTSARCTGSTSQCRRRNLLPQFQAGYQLNRNEGELPEMNRKVEKENGKSRSSRGGAAGSGRTTEVRTDREKRECGRSVYATSGGGTTSGAVAKWNNQQPQKRFRHKCRAHKYRKNDDAQGEKEIKLIKGMGRGWRAAIEGKRDRII